MGQINKSDVTFCSGPAGSGKTSVSVGMACEYLIEKKVDKMGARIDKLAVKLLPKVRKAEIARKRGGGAPKGGAK